MVWHLDVGSSHPGAGAAYKGSEYIPASDGTVKITSINPTMTVFTDTPGATIDIEYNADTMTYLENCFRPTDDQVQASVDAWLTKHYASAEGVRF